MTSVKLQMVLLLALFVLWSPGRRMFAQQPVPPTPIEQASAPPPTPSSVPPGVVAAPAATSPLPPGIPLELGEPLGLGPSAATPLPGAPSPVPFLPPLSLRDCLLLVERAERLLPPEDSPKASDVPVESLRRMVMSTYNYLTFRDDLHTSLANYDWLLLDDAKVENQPGTFDTDIFRFDPPITRISALSFEVQNGDAWLHAIRVYDEDSQLRQAFPLNPPKQLHQHLPRREVFHLWRRSTISRIEVHYSRATPTADVRVVIRGGITEQKEFIKTAIYCLGESLPAIEKRDWKTARAQLDEARRNILDYIRKNQIGA